MSDPSLDRAQAIYDDREAPEGCWHCAACGEEINEDEAEQDGLCVGCRGDWCEAGKQRREWLLLVLDRLIERNKTAPTAQEASTRPTSQPTSPRTKAVRHEHD